MVAIVIDYLHSFCKVRMTGREDAAVVTPPAVTIIFNAWDEHGNEPDEPLNKLLALNLIHHNILVMLRVIGGNFGSHSALLKRHSVQRGA
jgi:hypothetical protein